MVVQVATLVMQHAAGADTHCGLGHRNPLGVAGAGLASSIAIVAGVAMLWFYFSRLEKYVSFHAEQWQPRLAVWKRMLTIGLPAGGEFFLMFTYMALTYWVIRHFGAAAQAGFGIGSRVMQGIFLPAMAIAFAAAPVPARTSARAASGTTCAKHFAAPCSSTGLMVALTLLCQWRPEALIAVFSNEPEVIEVGALFLRIISWNFVARASCSPARACSRRSATPCRRCSARSTRLLTYAVPVDLARFRSPAFASSSVWHLSVATVALQTIISLLLLQKSDADSARADGSAPEQA